MARTPHKRLSISRASSAISGCGSHGLGRFLVEAGHAADADRGLLVELALDLCC